MTPERWRAVDAILQSVLACEPAQRAAFVAEACGDDAALRREVESLLAAEPDGDFLERPAVAALGGLVPASPPAVRLAAAVAGRYVVERELGRGGMATVHLARDVRHGRHVAIKVLRDELSAAVGAERFLQEIEVTAALQHPHILPLFDSGSADGLLYYVMPRVDGETLRARLAREGPLPVAEAVRLAREVAGALHHAHAHGVVHRDIKPENVLLQGGHALVADFGIALALQQAGGERLTRTGLTVGTPQYMAPEQARGDRAIDARADVYALGAVLHEMLAGESPFAGPNVQAVVAKVMHEAPPALASRRPGVPPYVDAAVRRALEKQPADRFPTAAAFAVALAEPAATPPPPGMRDQEPKPTPRRRSISARLAAQLAVAMLGVGLAAGWALARSPMVMGWLDEAPAATWQPAEVTPPPAPGEMALTLMDRAGRRQQSIAARRPWTPRFSPDGRRVAYGAFGEGRETSDVWVRDLVAGTTRRVTDDEDDGNDPQWSPDGSALAYSARAPGGKDLRVQRVDDGRGQPLAPREGEQFPSDWLRDGSALLVTDPGREGDKDILVQLVDGSAPRPFAATRANETAARGSPDGRWIAYTSEETGRAEVYVAAYADPARRRLVSTDGGLHPVWRGDGRELYFWQGDQLVALELHVAPGAALPEVRMRTPLFRAKYHGGVNTMYDVSPDGTRFVIVEGG